MIERANIPPQEITVGEAFERSFRLEDPTADTPLISLTGYTGTWALSEGPFKAPFATGALEITDADRFVVSISGAATALYSDYALPVIGGRVSAMMQIDLLGPTETQNIILQGPVIIAGTL